MKKPASAIRTAAAAGLVVSVWGQTGLAAEPRLQPGLYEVKSRVEMPNLGEVVPARQVERCIRADASVAEAIRLVLDNNPLRDCPSGTVTTSGDMLTFEIVCAGPNKPRAVAAFAVAKDRFDGLFRLNMGGKNMTMTEHQTARRIGDCH